MSASADQRGKLFWRLQGLMRRREAESVRDRMEELIEEQTAPRAGEAVPEDSLDAHERALLGNVLKLRGKTAYDVMVPRADIVAIAEDFSL